jgi:hypothetical protein
MTVRTMASWCGKPKPTRSTQRVPAVAGEVGGRVGDDLEVGAHHDEHLVAGYQPHVASGDGESAVGGGDTQDSAPGRLRGVRPQQGLIGVHRDLGGGDRQHVDGVAHKRHVGQAIDRVDG